MLLLLLFFFKFLHQRECCHGDRNTGMSSKWVQSTGRKVNSEVRKTTGEKQVSEPAEERMSLQESQMPLLIF